MRRVELADVYLVNAKQFFNLVVIQLFSRFNIASPAVDVVGLPPNNLNLIFDKPFLLINSVVHTSKVNGWLFVNTEDELLEHCNCQN